jgi:hypothetical protein
MNALRYTLSAGFLAVLGALSAGPAGAQVPVDGTGEPIGDYAYSDADPATGGEGIPLLSAPELQDLVGPVALYPDDLLAVVLPASTFPLQLVQAQRFLDELEEDPSLKPDEDWDDSVIALLNYPEVLALLNEDLDWTWQLGEAVVAQHSDVVSAVEEFRDRAYAAGNLQSDDRQTIREEDGVIHITPVSDDIIYVPYYEPERAVAYQPEPVIYYYPQPYPVYYYPYPSGYAFNRGFFWGVTTAYSLGWMTDRVHVIHHSYRSHPYYGRHYWDGWWYRRPSIHVHNHYYSSSRASITRHRYTRGDAWRPRYETRRRLSNHRIVQSNYYSHTRSADRAHVTRTARNTRAHSVPVTRTATQRREPQVRRSGEVARTDRRYRETPTQSRQTRAAPAQRQSYRSEDRRSSERPARNHSERRATRASREEPAHVRQKSGSKRSERSAKERKERRSSRRNARERHEH